LRLALGAASDVAGHTAVRADVVGGHVAHTQCTLVTDLLYLYLYARPLQPHIVSVTDVDAQCDQLETLGYSGKNYMHAVDVLY